MKFIIIFKSSNQFYPKFILNLLNQILIHNLKSSDLLQHKQQFRETANWLGATKLMFFITQKTTNEIKIKQNKNT